MARKIFVTYKHSDSSVQYLNRYGGTARAYVDYLIDEFKGDEIYKGEGNEDLSQFKRDTIKTRLKDKIHDSSVTIVLISPNMKESYKREADQWIPWEVSYSLKEVTRGDKLSHSNAMIAVALPDSYGYYNYYILGNTRPSYSRTDLNTNFLFQILRDNMFNFKNSSHSYHSPRATGEPSYILSVKWTDFISNTDNYIERAMSIRDNRKSYNLVREVQ